MTSFKEWNARYTKLLQARNKALRDFDAAWRDPVKQARIQVRVERTEAAAREWQSADRASGHVMRNLIQA